VSFRLPNGVRVWLGLQSPFTLSPGIEPSVATAVVPHHEYAKFGGGALPTGVLEFWYRSDPDEAGAVADVAYHQMRVIHVEPRTWGRVVSQDGKSVTAEPVPVDYTVFIADVRERLKPPRGGRVYLGVVNPELSENEDTDGKPATQPLETSALMVHALRQSGVGFLPPSASVDEAGPPTNLKWLGVPVAEALQKLLDHSSSVLTVTRAGQLQVWKLGEGREPDLSGRAQWRMSVDGADRRGRTVIFTSAPYAVLETREFNDVGGPSSAFQYVIQDAEGRWLDVNDPRLRSQGLLAGGGPVQTVRGHYAGVREEYRERVRSQLYHYLRLNPAVYVPGVQRIVRRKVNLARKVFDLEVRAFCARTDPQTRLWTNSTRPANGPAAPAMLCTAGYLNGPQNIIHVHELLGKLKAGPNGEAAAPTTDLEGQFEELAVGDLTVRLTMEAGRDPPRSVGGGDAKKSIPEYFYVGFRRGPDGEPVQLTAARLQELIDRPQADTVFISRPDLRLVRDYGPDPKVAPADNRPELEEAALGLAERYLASSRQPYTHICVPGYAAVDLNGLVSQVQLDPAALLTTVKLNNWWVPMGPQRVQDLQESVGPGFPNQGQILEDALALGITGAVQPNVPIKPPPPPVSQAQVVAVRLENDGGENGNKTKAATFTYTVTTAGPQPVRLGTKVSPKFQRGNGRLEPANWGLAFYDAAGVQLLVTDERFKQGDCPTP
jgi:hypothetical protein